MSRITHRLNALKQGGQNALVSFITTGDPVPGITVDAMLSLVRGGVDMLELGVPFTDPEADGPAIQRTSERVLANGITMSRTLEFVKEFRQRDIATPVILMGYLNTILALGINEFANRARVDGVDGVIVVNLPAKDAGELKAALDAVDIDLILLIAPTTSIERAKTIMSQASGFTYFVSLKGITGSANLQLESVRSQIDEIRENSDLPVLLGFGVRSPEIAKLAANLVDGVVVGTALVERMADATDHLNIPQILETEVSAYRAALDS